MYSRPYISFLCNLNCNLDCEYCDFVLHEEEQSVDVKSVTEVLDYLDSIVKFERYHLAGGEPGLLHDTILDTIINRYASKLHIYTNGLLRLRRDLSNVKTVLHHIFKPEDIEADTPRNLVYIIIATRKNLVEVKEVIRKCESLEKKLIVREVFPKVDLHEIGLTVQESWDIGSWIREPRLIRYGSNLDRTGVVNMEKLYCARFESFYQIDFCNDRIVQCCLNYTESPKAPLTEENLLLMAQGQLFKNTTKACVYCSSYKRLEIELSSMIRELVK